MHKCGKELLFIQFCIHYITRPHLVGIELENEMFTTMSCSFFRIYFLYFVSYKKGGVCETSAERTEGWYFSIYHWHLFINIKTQWTMVMQPNIQHNPPPLVPHFLLVFSHFILHHFSPHFFFFTFVLKRGLNIRTMLPMVIWNIHMCICIFVWLLKPPPTK